MAGYAPAFATSKGKPEGRPRGTCAPAQLTAMVLSDISDGQVAFTDMHSVLPLPHRTPGGPNVTSSAVSSHTCLKRSCDEDLDCLRTPSKRSKETGECKPDHHSRQPGPAGSVMADGAHSPDCDCSQHSGSAALAFMSLASPQNITLACVEACMRSDSSAGEDTHVFDCSDHSALVPLETPDVLRRMCKAEAEVRPGANSLANHGVEFGGPTGYIDGKMRAIAVSWLVEVTSEFDMHQETLFLAVNLLDRFLSLTKGLPRSSLQLAGVACELIAAKHEEERYPSVSGFTSIADNCFQMKDLVRMEGLVLQSLDFRVNVPTCFTFYSVLLRHLQPSAKTAALASYILELSILDYPLVHHPAPIKAAAALLSAVSFQTRTLQPYLEEIEKVVGAKPKDVLCCATVMLQLHTAAFNQEDAEHPVWAVKDKYREDRWQAVGLQVPLGTCQPGWSLPVSDE